MSSTIVCRNCGAENIAEAKFCGSCGASQAQAAPTPPPSVAPKPEVAPPESAPKQSEPPNTAITNSGGSAAYASAPAEQWAAAGEAEPNETYMGMRLTYNNSERAEVSFAQPVSGLLVLGFLFRSLLLSLLAFFVVAIVVVPLVLVAKGGSGSGAISVVLLVGVPLLAFVIGLLLPYRQLLSDWSLTLDGKATRADTAFATCYATIRDRGIPAVMRIRRIRSSWETNHVNNYLILKEGRYHGYLSLLPYGRDLFMTWTFWRSDTPMMMIIRLVAESFGGLIGHDELRRQMKTEPARALRECIHNAMRQGVEAAAENNDVSLQATFGSELPPVEESQAAGAGAAT